MTDLDQVQFVSLEQLVCEGHRYRQLKGLVDWKALCRPLAELDNKGNVGADGYGIVRLFQMLLLQWIDDLSDRELAEHLSDSNAARWFCGIGLTDKTPHFSLFSRVRSRIGTQRLAEVFNALREMLRQRGLMKEFFSFVDSSVLIAKEQLWKERDAAIAVKLEKLNNQTVAAVAADPDARFGCKGKDQYWYGYKEHVSVDMQSGLINKIAVTPANVTDAEGLAHVCPKQGAAYMDKGYCTRPATTELKRRGIHDGAIRKNNMHDKNRDKDRWISSLRAPFERVFSKRPRRVRYRGIVKNQFAAFFRAIGFNLERTLTLGLNSLQ